MNYKTAGVLKSCVSYAVYSLLLSLHVQRLSACLKSLHIYINKCVQKQCCCFFVFCFYCMTIKMLISYMAESFFDYIFLINTKSRNI